MSLVGKKQVISLLLNHRNVLSGASGGFVLIALAIINFTIIGPIFIPTIPRQPHVKDITVVIPNGGVETVAAAVRSAGFRKVYALSYDERAQGHPAFTSYQQIKGTFGDDITRYVNTSFVLLGSIDAFVVSHALPRLPDKPMVIGYSFSTCNEHQYALVGPVQLEDSLISREALQRFHQFATTTLKGSRPKSEEFRIFCDLHSLRLLMMPCRKRTGSLPKWESLDVIEYETGFPVKPWGSLPHVEEVWSIRDLI
jgi:hypothetical protein